MKKRDYWIKKKKVKEFIETAQHKNNWIIVHQLSNGLVLLTTEKLHQLELLPNEWKALKKLVSGIK